MCWCPHPIQRFTLHASLESRGLPFLASPFAGTLIHRINVIRRSLESVLQKSLSAFENVLQQSLGAFSLREKVGMRGSKNRDLPLFDPLSLEEETKSFLPLP